MVSPRCGCGYETRAGFRTFKKPAHSEEEAVTVQVETPAADGDTDTWRSQLERKFAVASRPNVSDVAEFHRRVEEARQEEDAKASPSPETPRTQAGPQTSTARPLEQRFRPSRQSPAVPEMAPVVADVDRSAEEPEVPVPPLKRPPEQQSLTLEPLTAAIPRIKPVSPPADQPEPISKEILFSRILAGILDLAISVLMGMLFVFAASRVLGLDFFVPEATRAWLAMAGFLFAVDYLYFYWTTGQTPGMLLTDLELVDEKGEGPEFRAIATRVVLLLLIPLVILGMAWALLDSQCRGLHDRLSKTKVIRAEEA
jgi:uncharacterized RDD family membrane protein YckC